MKIRGKFGFFSAGVVVVTVATLALVSIFLQRRMIESHMEEVRRTQSQGFAAVCRQAITTDNELFMVNFAKLLVESPGVDYAYYVDQDGRIRVHTDKRFFYKTLAEWERGRPSGVIEAEHPVKVGGSPAGTAVIGFSEKYVREVLKASLARTTVHVAMAAGAVALAVLPAALLFAVYLTRPVKALAEGSEAVGRGDFTVQVEVHSKDELGDLAGRFNEMTRQLAVLDEMKDDFISSVSHDLRSPMSAIKMYTQYMLFEDPEKDKVLPQHRTFLLTIMESATRLAVFVTNILDAAKLKAGRAEYHPQPMDPVSSAQNVKGIFGILAEKKNVALEVYAEPGLPNLVADPERFDHVIANLVSNALKFTPANGRITITVRAAGDRIAYVIQDTGKGISAENLGKLFRRFGQVDVADQRAKRVTGTGLGLFIVKQTVEGLGGTINVTSELGKGTCFTVVMPATRQPIPAPAAVGTVHG
jgi:signal transduction histidine kinase